MHIDSAHPRERQISPIVSLSSRFVARGHGWQPWGNESSKQNQRFHSVIDIDRVLLPRAHGEGEQSCK